LTRLVEWSTITDVSKADCDFIFSVKLSKDFLSSQNGVNKILWLSVTWAKRWYGCLKHCAASRKFAFLVISWFIEALFIDLILPANGTGGDLISKVNEYQGVKAAGA
jgi:hypothetical protein